MDMFRENALQPQEGFIGMQTDFFLRVRRIHCPVTLMLRPTPHPSGAGIFITSNEASARPLYAGQWLVNSNVSQRNAQLLWQYWTTDVSPRFTDQTHSDLLLTEEWGEALPKGNRRLAALVSYAEREDMGRFGVTSSWAHLHPFNGSKTGEPGLFVDTKDTMLLRRSGLRGTVMQQLLLNQGEVQCSIDDLSREWVALNGISIQLALQT